MTVIMTFMLVKMTMSVNGGIDHDIDSHNSCNDSNDDCDDDNTMT